MKNYKRSDIFEIPLEDLSVDPTRFQYKLIQYDRMGSTNSLLGVRKWDPNLAGTILVWHDKDSDKIYVVNGHNRYSKALSLGVKVLSCQFIKADNQRIARSIGALKNISEGSGNPIDAAKFFRDSRLSLEKIRQKGLLPDSRLVINGLILSGLSEPLFDRLLSDRLSIKDALIIGQCVSSDRQDELICVLDNGVTGSELLEYCHILNSTVKQSFQDGLFDIESLIPSFIEKAKLLAWIKSKLSKEKRIFSVVSRNKDELERVGNSIDAVASSTIADRAKTALVMFDQLKLQSGELSRIINSGINGNRENCYSQVLNFLNDSSLLLTT